MNRKMWNAAWLGGLLLILGGCASSQVSTYLFGLSQGDVRVYGYASIEEAAVAADAALTQANWKVKALYETDRVLLEGTTRGGKPFKILFNRATNSKGESWVQAKLDLPGSELFELQTIFPAAAPRRETPRQDTSRDNTAGAKK